MNIQMLFVLVMKGRTKQQKYAVKRRNVRTDGSLFTSFRPQCVPNLISSKDVFELDSDLNTVHSCSVMVSVFDVHSYDCECVLLTPQIGLNVQLTSGCAPGECVGEILLSQTQCFHFDR